MGVESYECSPTFLSPQTSINLNDFDLSLLRSDESFKRMESADVALLFVGDDAKITPPKQSSLYDQLKQMDWLEEGETETSTCDTLSSLDEQEFEPIDFSNIDFPIQPVQVASCEPSKKMTAVKAKSSSVQKPTVKRERKNHDPPKGMRVYYDVTENDVCMGRGGATNQHKVTIATTKPSAIFSPSTRPRPSRNAPALPNNSSTKSRPGVAIFSKWTRWDGTKSTTTRHEPSARKPCAKTTLPKNVPPSANVTDKTSANASKRNTPTPRSPYSKTAKRGEYNLFG